LVLAFAAWVVSGWFWDRAAPGTVYFSTVLETDPVVMAQSVAAKHLMGVHKGQAEGQDIARRGSFRLLGLMTASDRWPGFAILSQDGKESLVVTEGEEIVPGVSLIKVMSDQVVIRRDERTESIALSLP
jgi:type II secretory pathway component PulC